MNRQFLEFWGNFLINVAKGEKQMEDMAQWINQGFKGFEDLAAMFRNFYGLDRSASDYGKTWENAAKDFQKSFQDYLKLFGVVPMQEHLELIKKYEALKEKAAAQEETILHFKTLLDQKGPDLGNMAERFQELLKRQTDQFQNLMKSLTSSED